MSEDLINAINCILENDYINSGALDLTGSISHGF